MKFIHEKSNIEGDVVLGENVSVWAFASMRGDEGRIEIGDNTSVQESVVIHGPGVKVGKNVTIGHGAVLHGCTIGDNVLVGMNATIMNGAKIGDWSIVAAGSVVKEGTVVDPESLVAGVPAVVKKKISEEDKDYICHSCHAYVKKVKEKK